MNTFLKVFSGIVVLMMISVAGFVYTFDANKYKETVTRLAESATGRTIAIAGDMEISLYPWIGIKINDVTIENPSGFSNKTFASIGQFDVRLNIIPLLKRQLDIERLVLHRMVAYFERNASGENNWSDFSGASENSHVQSELGMAGLTIGGIDVSESSLRWLDTTSGKKYEISNLRLSTQAISRDQALPVELKAFVESNQPEWQAAVSAKTRLEFDQDAAIINAENLKLTARALLPGTEMGKLAFAMVADSIIDLQTQSAKLTNARLGVLDLVIGGTFDVENIFSVPVIQGSVKVKTFEATKLAKHFNFDIPPLENPQSLKKISMTASFKTDFDTVYMDNISANVDNSHVEGFVHIENTSQPAVRYELKADKVKLDDYRIASNGLNSDEDPLPLDAMSSVDLEGGFEIETATIEEIELHELHIASNIRDGIMTADPISMRLGDGEARAAIRLDARETPAVSLVAEVKQLDTNASINLLLKNIIGDGAPVVKGRVNADANLKATGSSVAALKASSRGTIKLNMDQAIVKGIDFDHASQSVVVDYAQRNNFRVSRTFNQEYIPDSETVFSSIGATFKVSHGKLVNSDLLMVSDKVNVTGSGSIDLITAELDYHPVIDMNVNSTVNIRDRLKDHPMQYHAHGLMGELTTDFDTERYDLHMGRLMIQEAKANRNRRINSQSQSTWENALSN